MLAPSASAITDANLDISLLLKAAGSFESAPSFNIQSPEARSSSASISIRGQIYSPIIHKNPEMGAKRGIPPHSSESPAKKQSKWSPEEDSVIIELRGKQMKWEDISKRLPGRSAISCRLHYQNYLERRSEWDEERKNKLARIYERFKPEIWAKVAEEMAVPWRAAEAMHWQIGETDMARRAGVIPFSLSSVSTDAIPATSSRRTSPATSSRRTSPGRVHLNAQGLVSSSDTRASQKYSSPSRTITLGDTSTRSQSPQLNNINQQQGAKSANGTSARSTPRRESTPRSVPPASPSDGVALAAITGSGRGLGQQLLPSVAEMTTGVSPYITSAYATSGGGCGVGYPSPGPVLPAIEHMRNHHLNSYHHQWSEINQRRDSIGGYHETRR